MILRKFMIKRFYLFVIFSLLVSCDSRTITYYFDNNNGEPPPGSDGIQIINLDFSGTNISHDFRESANASISPDGDRLVYQSGVIRNFEIYLMNIDGSMQTNITNNPGNNNLPVFTPDGNNIVFYRNADVYMMDLNGQDQRRISNVPVDINFPVRFSPDGTKAFVTSIDGGRQNITVINMDGSGEQNLTPVFGGLDVNIAPNSETLVYISGLGSNQNIYTMDFSGGNKRNLSNESGDYRDPVYSPDGNLIAYTKRVAATDFNNIFIIDADGSQQIQLTNVIADDLIPVFTPDGKWIAFNRFFSGFSDIVFIDLNRTYEVNYTNTISGFDLLPIFSKTQPIMFFQSDIDRDFDIWLVVLDKLPPL